ncbi:HD domain-containing protein, partial [Candidatus Kaiserbacteria bacterium]|nr:HD domain-containing protein [Candidatus Kaiserbacteria bacterium]
MGLREYYRYMNSANPRPLPDILAAMSGKSDPDITLVTKAYELSKEAHKDQKRYSGDSYFIHPAEVGLLLAEAGMDAQAIAAGLLHDTIEDAGV